MIIISRKALIYEIFLNQIAYQSIVCLILFGYSYGTRSVWDREKRGRGMVEVLKESGLGLLKLRGLLGGISLLSEFWGLKWYMKEIDGKYEVSVGVKRSLLIK